MFDQPTDVREPPSGKSAKEAVKVDLHVYDRFMRILLPRRRGSQGHNQLFISAWTPSTAIEAKFADAPSVNPLSCVDRLIARYCRRPWSCLWLDPFLRRAYARCLRRSAVHLRSRPAEMYHCRFFRHRIRWSSPTPCDLVSDQYRHLTHYWRRGPFEVRHSRVLFRTARSI